MVFYIILFQIYSPCQEPIIRVIGGFLQRFQTEWMYSTYEFSELFWPQPAKQSPPLPPQLIANYLPHCPKVVVIPTRFE